MEEIHRKFIDSLIEAEKQWHISDHLTNVTFPVVKDSKLLVRALEGLNKSSVITISNILKFEFVYRRVNLSSNPKENLDIFFNKCASNYGLSVEECRVIKEIITLGKKHKESGFEFSKREKAVIMDNSLGTYELTRDKMKVLLNAGFRLIESATRGFSSA